MSTSAPSASLPRRSTASRLLKGAALAILLLIAIAFVGKYVFQYYRHYTPDFFAGYWSRRLTLLTHITAGTVALLIGPWQFFSRLRRHYPRLHRFLGRTYLIAIAFGAMAGIRLALLSASGWAWQAGMLSLDLAWLITASVAWYAILRRQISQHKDWMVRSYVVTFAFVTYRILFEISIHWHIEPHYDWSVMSAWACWSVPLLVTEAALQLNHMRRAAVAR